MKSLQSLQQKYQNDPKSMRRIKTTIHWWDLYKRHYIKLKPRLQKEIFQKAIEKAGGHFTLLAKKLNINRKTISECYKLKRNPNIGNLIKIANFINFPLRKIEKNIVQISKSKFKPKLPFQLHNKEGAEIKAAFLSDGHIPKSPIKSPGYFASELTLHKRLIKLCKNIFGDFKTKTYFDGKTYVTKIPSVIGTALEMAGVSRGDKRVSKVSVPYDILFGSKEIKAAYLRRVFDDEADVYFGKNGKRAVRISRSIDITTESLISNPIKSECWVSVNTPTIPTHPLLLGEQLLLRQLGINAKMYLEGIYKSRRNKITVKWRLQIAQQDSLRKFAEIINFSLENKRKKLFNALKSYKINEFPNGETEKFAIKVLTPIYKKKGYFSFGDLGRKLEKIGKTYDLAGHYLKVLTEKKIIKKISRGKYVFLR